MMSPLVMLLVVSFIPTLVASFNSTQPNFITEQPFRTPIIIPFPMEIRIQDALDKSNISEKKDRILLAKQLLYCPSVSLCRINALEPNLTKPCCSDCMCSLDCYDYGTCCPDVLLTGIFYLKRTSCIRPQLKPYHFNSSNFGVSYSMVQKCKFGFQNNTIKTLCEKRSSFPNNAKELLTHIPVSSLITNETYKNRYCALCNDESMDYLLLWNPNIRCVKSQYIYPKSLVELLEFLKAEIRCNIIFNAPSEIGQYLRQCDWGIFTRCNQTGDMDYYDKQLEYFCEHYTSIYKWLYRNVFCYMCNSHTEPMTSGCKQSTIIEPFDIAAFTALIDFRSIESERQLIDENESFTDGCKNNQEYDPYKDICLDVLCAEGFLYFNGSCKSIYQSEGYKSFEVYFRITPGNNFIPDMTCVANKMHRMMDKTFSDLGLKSMEGTMDKSFPTLGGGKMSRTINKSFSTSDDRDVMCNKHILADIKMDNNTSCRESKYVNFFLIHLELGYENPHNNEQVVSDLHAIMNIKFIFEKDACQMPGYTVYEMQLDEGSYQEKSQFGKSFQLYIDQKTKKKLNILFTLHDNGMLACKTPVRLTRITRTYLCPSVTLSKNMYRFVYRENQICLADQPVCFNNTESQNNTDNLAVCSDSYFFKISKFQKNENESYASCRYEDHNLKIVSLMVTSISIVCLIIVFMVYCRFKELRTTPGKNNMTLSINLLIAQILYEFGSGQTAIETLCQIIGVSLHFFWLSTMLWMNICTIHMFQVFAKFGTKSIGKDNSNNMRMLRNTLFVYGISAFFVLINITVQLIRTSGVDIGYGGCSCYISTKQMIGFTFALPVGLIILTNLILFVTVVIKIHKVKDMSEKSQTKHRNTFIIYTKLSCLTGITWIIGFIYQLTLVEPLAYAFIVFNAGQGVYIFLAFICNKRVLNMIKQRFVCYIHTPKNSTDPYSNTNRKHNVSEQTTRNTPDSNQHSDNKVVKDDDDAQNKNCILEQTRL